MSIKRTVIEIIKDSHFYHRYHCSHIYRAKESKKNKSVSRFRAFIEVKPVHYRRADRNYQLSRIRKMLLTAKINPEKTGAFWFSLDENLICLYRDEIIGNIPVDCSALVDGSLADMRVEAGKHNNKIAEQNIRTIEIIEACIDRSCRELQLDKNNEQIISCLQSMKNRPAENLFEALQRILFIQMLLWQTGHYLMGLGRLDMILDRFSIDEKSEELLYDFIKALHTYYEFKSNTLLGDTGQIIILGGLRVDGSYFFNDYTELFIRILGSMNLPDPKIILRVSEKMPKKLLETAADCIRSGCGSPLLSNDDRVIPALREFGYEEEDAYNYGVSACWEPLVVGSSLEQNNLRNIEFGRILAETVCEDEFLQAEDYESVLERYLNNLRIHIGMLLKQLDLIIWEKDPLITLFTPSCMERGRDIADGGAKYSDYGFLSVGLAAAVNSLRNIQKYVFTDKLITKSELQQSLKNNFEGESEYRKLLSIHKEGFGSDGRQVSILTQQIMDCVEEELRFYRNPLGGKVKFGLSSPDYINLGELTGATADGRGAGEPFATHISGEGHNAMMETVRFAAGLDYSDCRSNGNVADIMLSPSQVKDTKKFCAYLTGCIATGIYQAQYNIVSYQTLVDALENPEKHRNLIVRVWGFSSYFNDLPQSYKLQLINRARMNEGL